MLNNRQFYFNQLVIDHSKFNWVNDDDDWIDFKKLLQTMIKALNEKKSLMNYAGSPQVYTVIALKNGKLIYKTNAILGNKFSYF